MNVRIIRFLDKHIGNAFCSFLSIFKKRAKKGFGEILIIQFWGVGETLLVLPAINAVRKKFPDSKITILTTDRVRDIFLLDRDIDEVISIRLNPISIIKFILKNKKRFDLVIDFEEYLNTSSIIAFFAGKYRIGFSHSRRSLLYDEKTEYNDKQHVVQTCLDLVKLLGIWYDAKKLIKINVPVKDKNFVNELFKNCNISEEDFLIGISPGAAESAKSRMWPGERYAELADMLIERYKAKIIFIGSKDEERLIKKIVDIMKNRNQIINTANKVNLKQLFYLIEKCNLVISNDTGPMHIAAAQQVKTIGLFGPNLPVRWKPYGEGNTAIYKRQECSPCINVHLGQVPECRWHGKDYQKCMKAIKVQDVLKAVEKVI